jgi:hypothetical protein
MSTFNSTLTFASTLDRLGAITLGELVRSPLCLTQLVQLYLSRHEIGRQVLDRPLLALWALAVPVVLLYGILGNEQVKEVEWETPRVSGRVLGLSDLFRYRILS